MIMNSPNRTLFLVAAGLLLAGVSGWSVAGEVAVDPADNGTDIRDDTTEDEDSRSSEVTAAVEEFVEAVPSHSHDVPLAEAVTSAEGQAEPLRLLGAEIAPGDSMRLSWSATELFEGVPWSTDRVLTETLRIADEQRIAVFGLEVLGDVDRPEDLANVPEDLLEGINTEGKS